MKEESDVRVIPLGNAPGSKQAWTKSPLVIISWIVTEFLFVTNPLQLSSGLRAFVLRAFGAKIGKRVILRPRMRVKFPWNLEIGHNCWIGEGVWIHNQDKVIIGEDVCISQETFITTGSHDYKNDMALITKPVLIESGAWICSRAIITAGSVIESSAIIPAGVVCSGRIPANSINGIKKRFRDG